MMNLIFMGVVFYLLYLAGKLLIKKLNTQATITAKQDILILITQLKYSTRFNKDHNYTTLWTIDELEKIHQKLDNVI